MREYVGIDLGTTNSAICSYDGEQTRIWKSPQQNDVTPSAIYIDRRGNKYIGSKAYDIRPSNPDNTAVLFKRLMGTSTPVKFPAVGKVMTPEECSAEVLKVLFGYLPEEIRNGEEVGTVITVPAAFNQMQKEATLHAAEMAGIGKVSLMQEPVAAVMSVMRARKTEGVFLIYDFGGGTLDLAVAESLEGRVNLLSHGGIALCGGRDFDRLLLNNIVKPWLYENFNLPDNLMSDPQFSILWRLAEWATERGKIELSAKEETLICLSENEIRIKDLSDQEIFLEIPVKRSELDNLIEDILCETINATRDTLNQAGLHPQDVERIVFIGGPSNYKPLRDKVSFELGIPASTEVNPMTAVAEGASLFAESIDWTKQDRGRKSRRGQISSQGEMDIVFNYIARTPGDKSKIAVQIKGEILPGSEFQIDCIDNGWTSGRMPLEDRVVEVSLSKMGDNHFKVFVFDESGGSVTLPQDKMVISRTTASVEGIPASNSISIEVMDRLGGRLTLDPLVRSGERLPKKGKKIYKAAKTLKSGDLDSLNFKVWEGEIKDPITDNRLVGTLKISGMDFDAEELNVGSELHCEYEILDSGNIVLEVSVPSIGALFHSGHTFYSIQDAQIDYSTASERISEEGTQTLERLESIAKVIEDPKIEQARNKLETATSLDKTDPDVEMSHQAMENIHQAKKLLAEVREKHLKAIREMEINDCKNFFDEFVRKYARPSEEEAFENLIKTAERAIEYDSSDFESHMDELRSNNFEILWRQDWFVVERFKWMLKAPSSFADKIRFEELSKKGLAFLRSDDIDNLRNIVALLAQIRISSGDEIEMLEAANIVRG